MKRAYVVLICLFFASPRSIAGTMCDAYRESSPDLYKEVCGNEATASRPTGAQSSFSDSLNLNAASIPTGPTSYGAEGLYSFIKTNSSVSTTNFGLVKGFKRYGLGFISGGGNSFYDNDLLRRQYQSPELKDFTPYESPKSTQPNLNFSTAINLFDFAPGVNFNLGATVRYLNSTDTWGGGPSLLFESPYLSIGAGIIQLQIASNLPNTNFTSTLAILKLLFIELEYNRLDALDTFNLGAVEIGTVSLRFRRFILSAAQRRSKYELSGTVTQNFYSIQYLLLGNLSLGFMDNYIPGCRTVGMQIFL